MALSLTSGVRVPYSSPSCFWQQNGKSCKALPKASRTDNKNPLLGIGIGVVTACVMGLTALDADATRIEYYAPWKSLRASTTTLSLALATATSLRASATKLHTVGNKKAKLAGQIVLTLYFFSASLQMTHYKFTDGTVFDSSYKRVRPLTMRIGVGKVIKGLDQGILGGEGVPPMRIGDCNIPGNATLLYDIIFVEL
ncbi:hypothetical protein Fmac_014624 [Flemingia macrophylla]|uniref:peptidylprolyl isomerase n=1 Tax=Flemingia macrophylla TaxID=520843 RepID=A0ABD1MC94_9FABA